MAEGEHGTAPPPIERSDVAFGVGVIAWTWVILVVLTSWQPDQLRMELTVPAWSGLAFQTAVAGTLVFRRRRPELVQVAMILAITVMVAQTATGQGSELLTSSSTTLVVPAAAPFASYVAISWTRRPWLGWLLVLLELALVARAWAPYLSVATVAAVFLFLPALLGLYTGARRRLISALTERAARARREQSLLAERARAEERSKIAEEMRDVVTHRVDRMIEHTGRLAAMASEPATRRAAGELSTAGYQALAELEELVAALRSESGTATPTPPQTDEPGDTNLHRLVAESESVGVPVELVVEGDPGQLSPTVARTAGRVVQEALTNVRKHAPGATTRVRVRYAADRALVSVRNDPPPGAAHELASDGSGTGLLGLRQRIELLDGIFAAGPTETGGFAVDAILPSYVPTSTAPPEEPTP